MTLDEAIKEFADWAKGNRKEQNFWAAERDENDETNPLSYADCEGLARDAETRAEYHEQLAEWLMDYKELKNSIGAAKLSNMKEALELIRAYKTENATLREENKVLTSECDRLIKEKGELLNKVSGGDVLRICQLEDQLEKAKELLKFAVEDFSEMKPYLSEPYSHLCDKWRYADEALKLLNDEKINNVE